MSQLLDVVNEDAVSATGVIDLKQVDSARSNKKIGTRGQHLFTLTSDKNNASGATVILKGTNNPDPADTNGETLITNTHTGSDQKDGSAASKGYKYVFVHVTALAGGSFAAGEIMLYGTGFAGGA